MVAGRHGGRRVFAADDGTRIEVVVACPVAQGVHLHVAFGVAGKGQRAPLLEQGLEADLVTRRDKTLGFHDENLSVEAFRHAAGFPSARHLEWQCR